MVLAQGLGVTCSVLSVTVAPLAGHFVTGSLDLATVPHGAQFLATLLSIYGVSRLMEVWGRRRVLVGVALLGLLTTPLALWALEYKSLWLLIMAHMFLGVFLSGTHLYRFAILDVTPKKLQARAISLVMLGGVIAAVVGPTIARNTGWYADSIYVGGYIAMGVLSLLVASLIVGVRFPKPKKVGVGVSVGKILHQPLLWFAALCGGGGYGVMSGIMAASSLEMSGLGMHFHHISWAIQWHVVAMFLPSLVSGLIIERIGISRFLVLGMLLMVVSAVWGLQEPLYTNFFVSLLFLGLGWNFLFVGSSYLVGHYFSGEEKFRAQGLNDTLIHVCSTSGSFGSGYALYHLGWEGLQYMSMLVMAGVFVFFVVMYVKRLRADG
jgi:MFS family permease